MANRPILTPNAPARELDQREHVDARSKSMMAQRQDYEGVWHEIAGFTGHGNVPQLMQTPNGARRNKPRALFDSHATRVFDYVQNGMYSGLSSPNRPWRKSKFMNRDLNEYHAARVWLDEVDQVLNDLYAASNFYQVAKMNYGCMAKFGPACAVMSEHWRRVAPTSYEDIGYFWFDLDECYEVDTMMRACPMTVRQVVEKFVRQRDGSMKWDMVSPRVHTAWDNSNYGQIVECRQIIEPGFGQFPWQSTIWDQGDDRQGKTLEEKGFYEQPFWAPRWDERGNDVYGMGRGEVMLPDLRELQMQAKRKGELTDLTAKPPTQGPPKKYNLRPGGHTTVANTAEGKIETIYIPDGRAIPNTREDIADLKGQISDGAYADLFMMFSQREGIQPLNMEEIFKIQEEKLAQLGPVIETVNNDMLPVADARMYGIAQRGGLLPPVPEELAGEPVTVEFTSMLAQLMKMTGLSQTERVVGFAGSMAQVLGPEVLDTLDGDEIITDYAERAGVPAKAMRDMNKVKAMRESRQQQEQMEQMAAMAQPAKDATTAAANMLDMSGQAAPGSL